MTPNNFACNVYIFLSWQSQKSVNFTDIAISVFSG